MGINHPKLPPSPCKYNRPESSNSSYGGTHQDHKNNQYLNDEEKNANYNRRATLQLILDYYNKQDTFYGFMDEYWHQKFM